MASGSTESVNGIKDLMQLGGLNILKIIVPGNGTAKIRFPANTSMHGMFFTSGATSTKHGLYFYGIASTGTTITLTTIHSATAFSQSTTNRVMTISNGEAGQMVVIFFSATEIIPEIVT